MRKLGVQNPQPEPAGDDDGTKLAEALLAQRQRAESWVRRRYGLSAEDAQDVVSDAIAAVWTRHDRIPPSGMIMALWYAIRRYGARSYRRGVPLEGEESLDTFPHPGGPHFDLVKAELARGFDAAVAKLSRARWTALYLRACTDRLPWVLSTTNNKLKQRPDCQRHIYLRICRWLAVFVFSAVSPSYAQTDGAQRELEAARRAVARQQLAFFDRWLALWKVAEGERHELVPGSFRGTLVHCHYRESSPTVTIRGFNAVIVSRREAFAVCPSYLDHLPSFFAQLSAVPDERMALDNALAPHRPGLAAHWIDSARAARGRLIELLGTLVARFPGDSFLVGQHIRFLVDQGAADEAVASARRCQARRSWCAALMGYALAATGHLAAADSAFEVAMAAMPYEARCAYVQSASQLLDAPARKQFETMDCQDRIEFARRAFWLADPLLVVPGNERRVEHHMRVVTIALRSALERDERHPWRGAAGADARETLILRYGWPTYVFWNGPPTDANHYTYLVERGTDPSDPYTTYEYSVPRYHMVPDARALDSPFTALPTDWEIASREVATRLAPAIWWPVEHFAAPYALTQLDDIQVAALRRQDDVLVVAALRLDASLLRRFPGHPIDSLAMVVSAGADDARIVARGWGVTDSVTVMRGRVASQPLIVGVEGFPEPGRSAPVPRTRFGLVPPAPLNAMAPGEVAISVPVLLRATADAPPAIPDPESALDHMLGSERLTDRSIAVYWETYGLRAIDSVELAVSIEATSSGGVLRRLGRLLRLVGGTAPVAVNWTEPSGGRQAAGIDGPVPIVARRIDLDLSHVSAGEYILTVGVRSVGGDWVENHRRIVVR